MSKLEPYVENIASQSDSLIHLYKTLQAVFDEAKKDFPTQKTYYSVTKCKEELKDIYAWFEKWFSDIQQTT